MNLQYNCIISTPSSFINFLTLFAKSKAGMEKMRERGENNPQNTIVNMVSVLKSWGT